MNPADGMRRALRHFWHPVCTAAEVDAAAETGRAVSVRLLGEDIVIARLGGVATAFGDRCLHRSTRLSLGCVDGETLRCAGHGWRWDGEGRCVDVPGLAARAIPARARLDAHEAEEAHGLVWVRLEEGLDGAVPLVRSAHLYAHDGAPYVWSTSAARRLEFAAEPARWAHLVAAVSAAVGGPDGTGSGKAGPGETGPGETAEATQAPVEFELQVEERRGHIAAVLPADVDAVTVDCLVTLPFTIDLVIRTGGGDEFGWWLTASPVDDVTTRCFWRVRHGRSERGAVRPVEALSDVAAAHMAALRAEEEVLTSAVPAALPLAPGSELSTRRDVVSVAYRRALLELVAAGTRGAGPLSAALRGSRAGSA